MRWSAMAFALLCVIYCDPIRDRVELLYRQEVCLNHRNVGTPVSLHGSSPPDCWVRSSPITAARPGPARRDRLVCSWGG